MGQSNSDGKHIAFHVLEEFSLQGPQRLANNTSGPAVYKWRWRIRVQWRLNRGEP
ncbi:hypothetical protein GGE67_006133 [Rhizobium leucaenae]|uniref:Uncharacterized protein n=1 Tax=Rhizobium leucaenae TaxID=29450 RepID=A0A7W7A034_9HYPH|nr:hypothetical protein [Rhizobium leucaenae]MBB6305464.1 hypothetical protein [Rhizobium leucaenae]